MNRLGALLLLAACTDPAAGTFVGNPELTFGFEDNEVQRGAGGRLELNTLTFEPCDPDDDTEVFGPLTLDLLGTESTSGLQIPGGEYCAVRVGVEALRLAWTDGGVSTAVVGGQQDVELEGLSLTDGERYRLRLGDAGWLAAMAPLTTPGENVLDGSNPALEAAYTDGLVEGSAISAAPTATPEEPLPGRLDLEGYPVSPRGTPTSGTGCTAGGTLPLAVPLPPAAMHARGFGDAVGWCEADVTFSADPAYREAVLVDYSDLSTYAIVYNGWSQGCDALHCGALTDAAGAALGPSCTVFATCDFGDFSATGYAW